MFISIGEAISEKYPDLEFQLSDQCFEGLTTLKKDPDRPGYAIPDPDSMLTKAQFDECVAYALAHPDRQPGNIVVRSHLSSDPKCVETNVLILVGDIVELPQDLKMMMVELQAIKLSQNNWIKSGII